MRVREIHVSSAQLNSSETQAITTQWSENKQIFNQIVYEFFIKDKYELKGERYGSDETGNTICQNASQC